MFNPLQLFKSGPEVPLIQDQNLINRIYKQKRLSVMTAITLGYGFAYTCRLALSVVKKPLIDGGLLTANQLGIIGSAFLYTYAFSRFTNGFLADHANIKRFFSFGLLISALINLVMGSYLIVSLWIVLWGLNGWFQGFGSVSSVVSMSHWFSNNERGRYYGIWSTAHSLGEGLTFIGTAGLVSLWGWNAGFIGPGLFCILVALGLFLALQDRPRTMGLPTVAEWRNDHGLNQKKEASRSSSTINVQLQIFRMPAMWVLGMGCACISATRYAINSWGILYLQEAKGYTLMEAGGILGLNTIAGIAGCAAYGFISDKLFHAKRPPVTLIYGVVEVLALSVIFFGPAGNPILMTAAFTVYGFSLAGILASLGGLFAIDITPKKVSGAAMGFIGIFSYFGAAFQERISGFLIQKGTTIIDDVRFYDFDAPVLFWIGTSIVSLILATSLWRVKPAE